AYIAWAKGGPRPPPLRANLIGVYTSTWDTVKSRSVPFMPLRERLALASTYDLLSSSRQISATLRTNLVALEALYAHATLSPSDASRVLETA
ncbi:hypothetical protein ABTM19_19845, partial [Acinetobacter baumannii]